LIKREKKIESEIVNLNQVQKERVVLEDRIKHWKDKDIRSKTNFSKYLKENVHLPVELCLAKEINK